MPRSAVAMRRTPSKWKGLVTTPTVRMPCSLAARAMMGAAPVPVPPPMPAQMKAMWEPARWSRISGSASSAAAAPICGCEPAPKPCVRAVPICTRLVAAFVNRACASVFATTNSTPSRRLSIMLLTALPPAPPTPNTTIRGFSSERLGTVSLIDMFESRR